MDDKNLDRYMRAMALARSMLKRGIITDKDYAIIQTIIGTKYGVKIGSLYR